MEKGIELSDVPHCKHYVKRKKRFCKMTLRKGEEYCGEHMPSTVSDTTADTESTKLRIVCPLDPKHTCYAHKLTMHLKVCNARQDTVSPYIEKGVNCGEITQDLNRDSSKKVCSLNNYLSDEISNVVEKINKTYNELKIEINEKVLKHDLVEEELCKPEYGDKTKKHLYQTSSILGYLKEYNLIQPDTCFIEFGAGRGQLSFWLANAIEKFEDSKVLLVERASPRHKMDNKLDKSSGITYRIRADIGDLVLSKVEELKIVRQVVGVTKHLCGEATDLALRCLKKYQDDGRDALGLVMAFCCHHRCNWAPYTGKEFFKEHGFSEADFGIMRGIVSWATCGTGFSREKNRSVDSDMYMNSLETVSDRDKAIGLSRIEKEAVGKKCKIILNYGRMDYLQKLGFTCRLHYYVSPNVSLENLCIVAYRENK